MNAFAAARLFAMLLASFGAQLPQPDAPAGNQSDAFSASVDKLFAEWNTPNSPGCSVGVSRKGAVLYEKGYGTANLELGVPITPDSVFEAASITKAFTAMSVMLLAQRGKLSLDDEVRKHIPEWSTKEVTIRHLLTHTAGLRDVFLLVELAAPHSGERNRTLVSLLARQRGLNFKPGSEFQYNNGGYTVLADIVKRTSGQSFREFADENIFKPLAMTRTHVHDDHTRIVRNRATGYQRNGQGFRHYPHLDRVVGNSGLMSTARDLLRWAHNFTDARVGDKALLAAMQTPAVLGAGDKSPYGPGLEIGEHRGLRTIGHSGGGGGFATNLVRYPEQDFAVAVLCNVDNMINPVVLSRSVAEIYLGDALSRASPAATPAGSLTLTAGQLASKAGLYRDRDGTYGRILVREGKLLAIANAGTEGESYELTPVDANRFVLAGTPIAVEFVSDSRGRARELRVTGFSTKPTVSERVEEGYAPTAAELRAFAGQYRSEDLDVTYTLAPRDSGLVLRIPGRPEILLRPIFSEAFHGSLVDVMRFSRGPRGVVTGFTVHTGGARNLRFDRVRSD